MSDLFNDWTAAKEAERQAVERRREIEDALIAQFGIPEDLDGTENREQDGYKVKIVGRLNRKIDSDKIQELAAENGLSDHLSSLCRWKPELNMSVWKATDKSITEKLAPAITVTPGRPSFTITKE
jgi:hypothetical protein